MKGRNPNPRLFNSYQPQTDSNDAIDAIRDILKTHYLLTGTNEGTLLNNLTYADDILAALKRKLGVTYSLTQANFDKIMADTAQPLATATLIDQSSPSSFSDEKKSESEVSSSSSSSDDSESELSSSSSSSDDEESESELSTSSSSSSSDSEDEDEKISSYRMRR